MSPPAEATAGQRDDPTRHRLGDACCGRLLALIDSAGDAGEGSRGFAGRVQAAHFGHSSGHAMLLRHGHYGFHHDRDRARHAGL